MVLGRPKKGNEVREVKSVRVEPRKLAKLKKHYGTLQKFLDSMIRKELKRLKNL